MALTRPILLAPPAFDATNSYTFTFSVSGGDQVVGNKLVIAKQDSGEIVYNKTITSFSFSHTVTANTLTNGTYYNATLYTNNSNGVTSPASNIVQFYCYAAPQITFSNFPADSIIKNGTYNFQAEYTQNESEALNSYIYNLYDSQRILISTSGTKYVGSITVPPTEIEYSFSGLNDNTTYYIEIIGRTINNTEVTTGIKQFFVKYEVANVFTAVQLTNNCKGGYITVKSNMISIDGISNPNPPLYVFDDTAISIRNENDYVSWNSGFSISGDFTASLWGVDFNEDSTIITLENEKDDSSLVVNYRSDGSRVYAELFTTEGNLHYYIVSDKIATPSENDKIQVWFRRVGNLYDIGIININE